MMIETRALRAALLLTAGLVVLALAGCGGGGGGSVTGGGIGGTGLTIGPNEEEGSVKVEGVAFDVSTAEITISGNPAEESDVKQGMVAVVTGRVLGDTGVADRVDIEEIVEGAVEQLIDEASFIVLGQTVLVDDATVFGPGITPPNLGGVNLGDLVKVFGFVKREGIVLATRIEREGSLPALVVRGLVQNTNLADQTFTIGGKTVDFSGADTSRLPGGVPQDGQLVAVKGLNALSTLGEIIATVIKLVDFVEIDDVVLAKIEGFVTRVANVESFAVGGHAVATNADTRFVNGTALDVVAGVRVQVQGRRQNDVLIASTVVFQAVVRLESDVATVGTNSFTLVGLPGIVIKVNAGTEYEELATSIADVEPGDHVEVRATLISGSNVLAARVKETEARTDVVLQGPVLATPAPSDPTFSILGVVVDTTGLGDDDFEDANDQAIGRDLFFSEIAAGIVVKAEGDLSGVDVAWDEMSFEGEDD